MITKNTYYKLAALEAIDSLWYPFYYQGYDPNYPVLQKSAGALGMIGTRLICNIAFKDRNETQAKIAHTLLPIIVGFGLYFMTAKKGDTLKTCLYNYGTQMLSHTLQSLLHFAPQKTIEKQVKDLCPEQLLDCYPELKKKEKIRFIIHMNLNQIAFEQPKDLPKAWVFLASKFLNGMLENAAQMFITPVATLIVTEKVDRFVASILGTIAAHYIASLIKQLPVSSISPMFLVSYAFATAIKNDIECSLWTSETKS